MAVPKKGIIVPNFGLAVLNPEQHVKIIGESGEETLVTNLTASKAIKELGAVFASTASSAAAAGRSMLDFARAARALDELSIGGSKSLSSPDVPTDPSDLKGSW